MMREVRSAAKMRQTVAIALLLGALLPVSSAYAAPPNRADASIYPDCQKTPAIGTSNYPGFAAIMSENNLVQPAGKPDSYVQNPVYLTARVFDSACVPVSDAKIELWQADENGRYRFATKAALASADAVFAGAGRATSDNLGQFQFVTLYPAGYSFRVKREDDTYYRLHRAAHFNLRISHDDFRSFNTNLFFENDPDNAKDYKLRKLSALKKPRVIMRTEPLTGGANAGLRAYVDIILPQRQSFRKY